MSNYCSTAQNSGKATYVTPSVYVADNDIDVSKSIEFLLSTAGINTTVFVDGLSLFDCVLGHEPSCVVVATLLSDISGVALMKQFHQAGIYLPVIILASTSDASSGIGAVKSGAWDYFEKPFMQHVLLDSIRRAVN